MVAEQFALVFGHEVVDQLDEHRAHFRPQRRRHAGEIGRSEVGEHRALHFRRVAREQWIEERARGFHNEVNIVHWVLIPFTTPP
jgi:hypothetical protein